MTNLIVIGINLSARLNLYILFNQDQASSKSDISIYQYYIIFDNSHGNISCITPTFLQSCALFECPRWVPLNIPVHVQFVNKASPPPEKHDFPGLRPMVLMVDVLIISTMCTICRSIWVRVVLVLMGLGGRHGCSRYW